MIFLAAVGTLMLACSLRAILHHERLWHQRRSIILHGQRRPFYANDSSVPPSWFDEGVTT